MKKFKDIFKDSRYVKKFEMYSDYLSEETRSAAFPIMV